MARLNRPTAMGGSGKAKWPASTVTASGARERWALGVGLNSGQSQSRPNSFSHAGCFTMALSLILGEAKLTAGQMDTTAEVTLEQVEGGFAITAIHLTLKAKIPGADQATFE